MSLISTKERVHQEQLRDTAFVTKLVTATLKPYELFVNINTVATADPCTITLPPVAEMIGKLIVLYVTGFQGAITIAAADSIDFSAPSFGEADDGALLFSDGLHWWTLAVRT